MNEDTDDTQTAASDDDIKSVMARIKAARDMAVTPMDSAKFDQAEDQAKQLYKDQASRAEWLSLADKIGQSMIRLNAANQGLKKGVDLSHVDLGPGMDWQNQIGNAQKDYSTEIGLQENRRQRALQNQGQEMGLAEKAFDTAIREKALQAQEGRLDKRLQSQDTLADKRQAAQEAAATARMQQQEALQNSRLKQQSELEGTREEARDTRLGRRETVKDLDQQAQETAKQYQAAAALGNQLQNEDDIGSKARDKIKAQYGDLAGKANIDPSQLERIQDQSKGEGLLGTGILPGTDKKKRNSLYQQQILAPLREKLEGIRNRKQQLLQGGGGSAPADTTSAAEPAASGGEERQGSLSPLSKDTVRVKYKGQLLDVPKSSLKDAMNDGAELAQ